MLLTTKDWFDRAEWESLCYSKYYLYYKFALVKQMLMLLIKLILFVFVCEFITKKL